MATPLDILGQGLTQALSDPTVARVAKAYALVTVRLMPLIAFTPLFGGELVSRRLRGGLALVLGAALTPALVATEPAAPGPAMPMALAIAAEFAIGLAMAVAVEILFATYRMFGGVVDQVRGASNQQVFNPLGESSEPQSGVFFGLAGLVLFTAVQGHAIVLRALAESYLLLPQGVGLPAGLIDGTSAARLVELFGRALAVCVQLAAPALAIALLVDVLQGLSEKLAHQFELQWFELQAKTLLVVGVTIATIGVYLYEPLQRLLPAVVTGIRGTGGGHG